MWLNRKKEYGTVHGDTAGAIYEQGNLLFDGNGKVLADHPNYTDKHRKVSAEMLAQPDTEPEPDPVTAENVSLRDWALGNQGAPFMAVRAAIKKKYGKSVVNGDQAIHALIEVGVVKPAEVGKAV